VRKCSRQAGTNSQKTVDGVDDAFVRCVVIMTSLAGSCTDCQSLQLFGTPIWQQQQVAGSAGLAGLVESGVR